MFLRDPVQNPLRPRKRSITHRIIKRHTSLFVFFIMADAIFFQPLEEVALACIDQSKIAKFVGTGEEFPDEFDGFFALPFVEATSFLNDPSAIVPLEKGKEE